MSHFYETSDEGWFEVVMPFISTIKQMVGLPDLTSREKWPNLMALNALNWVLRC